MIATGEPPRRAIDTIAKQFNTTRLNASRVIMTESAYFASEAQKDCYKELGLERYEIVGALDKYTCEICSALDGKVYEMSQYEVGATAPPFHPWCRCCTAPYFEDMEGLADRIARDPTTGEQYNVPDNMTYEEWKKEQEEKYGVGTIDLRRKALYNETEDRKQYDLYIGVLGSNAPKNFEDFQKLKYSDDWRLFKDYKRSIEIGELTTLADFDLFNEICIEADTKLIGLTTVGGTKIMGNTAHLYARIIGSVEQRRNGVTVDDILSALTSEDTEVLPIRASSNGRSQKYRNYGIEVTVNPDTGNVIQANPIKKKGKE